MNLKIFADGKIDDDWDITTDVSSLEHVYQELLWEMNEYAGDTRDDFVIIHDKTAYQLLVILQSVIQSKRADEIVINDLQKLSQNSA